ncbi:MAG: hypothetical protein PVJ19_12200 [Desulfobacteraceae bacterium]|jgi:hypothetical protein
MDEILTPKEVGERLKVSISWVYENMDLLGGFKLAGHVRFTERGLSDAIQRGQSMARNRHVSRGATHQNSPNKKGRKGLGKQQKKGVERGLEETAARHGFAKFIA